MKRKYITIRENQLPKPLAGLWELGIIKPSELQKFLVNSLHKFFKGLPSDERILKFWEAVYGENYAQVVGEKKVALALSLIRIEESVGGDDKLTKTKSLEESPKVETRAGEVESRETTPIAETATTTTTTTPTTTTTITPTATTTGNSESINGQTLNSEEKIKDRESVVREVSDRPNLSKVPVLGVEVEVEELVKPNTEEAKKELAYLKGEEPSDDKTQKLLSKLREMK